MSYTPDNIPVRKSSRSKSTEAGKAGSVHEAVRSLLEGEGQGEIRLEGLGKAESWEPMQVRQRSWLYLAGKREPPPTPYKASDET